MIRRSMMPMLGQAQTPEQEAQQMNILRLMQSATNQQARSQGAFDMMRRGNNGAGGYLGALAMGIGGYLNRKKQEKAEAQQLEALREIGLLKQSQGEWAREQAARQAAAEQAKYERDKADEAEKYAREQAGRMELAAYKAQHQKPMQITNNMPTQGEIATEFQKKMAGKNAEKYNEWENQAYSANETLAGISQLRQISEAQQTGRMNEAMAMAGQYFGTEAGANMQAFKSISSNLVLQQAEKLKGAMSDGDIRLLESTMPNFGNDPRANEVVFNVLENASNRSIKRFNDADAYVQEHGKLGGFKPEFQFSRSETKAQPKQKQGGQIMVDANGNRAMVYPDGSFEEL